MEKLKLSTKKSLHDPIEIEIDDKVYVNKPLTKPVFTELRKLQKAAEKGDDEALYSQIKLIFPIPDEVLDELDIRDISKMLSHATQQIIGTIGGTEEEKERKNVSKPGSDLSA